MITCKRKKITENIFIDDILNINAKQITDKCSKLKNKIELDFVVIDYLQLMNFDTNKDMKLQISELSRQLKYWAVKNKTAILLLSQLPRHDIIPPFDEDEENYLPTLKGLRECGSLEEDCDNVLFLYEPDIYGGNEQQKFIDLIVAINRYAEKEL